MFGTCIIAKPGRSLAALALLCSACGGGGGGGGTSQPPPAPPGPPGFTITRFNGTASNGATFSVRVLNIGAFNLEWDANRRLIYASVPASSTLRPRTVAAFDPVAETIVGTAPVSGGDPTRMRMTSDGSELYVSVPGARRVLRLDLPALTQDLSIDLGTWSIDHSSPLFANDLAPKPDSASTVAIVASVPGTFPPITDVVVYDDAVPRPALFNSGNIAAIEWSSDSSQLYGATSGISSRLLYRLDVDLSGVTLNGGAAHVFLDPVGFMDRVDGRINSNFGEVIEEPDFNRVGWYPTPFDCHFAKPEPGAALAFALCGSETDPGATLVVHSFDRQTFRPVARATIPNLQLGVNGVLSSLIHWGLDGLAFMTPGNQVVLLNGDFVGSLAPTPETPPTTQVLTSTGVSRVGSAFTVRQMRIWANDAVSDPMRNVLYLSLGGNSPFAPNTVSVLDALAGTILRTVAVGSDPNTLAISRDSQFLYVGTDGASAVRRFQLDDFSQDATLRLGRDPNLGPYYARQIFDAPGLPRTVGIARSEPPRIITTPADGVTVFDDSTQRPNIGGRKGFDEPISFPNGPFTTFFRWGADASTIYGANGDTSLCEFSRYAVDSEGLNIQHVTPQATCFDRPFIFHGGLIYSAQGKTFQTSPFSIVSQVDFGIAENLIFPMVLFDEARDRFIYYATSGPANNPTFWISFVPRSATTPQDVISYRRGEEQTFPSQIPFAMALWGQDGVAIVLENGQLLLINGPAVAGP